MGKGASGQCRCWSRILLASLLEAVILLSTVLVNTPSILPTARAQPSSSVGSILPAKYPLLFGSNGNIEIDIPKPGIAVRIEIPREFLQNLGALGSWPLENDTRFVTSNIRNDYYYYNLVDESKHWTYDWHDNASDGPCFKPNFSYYDSNAPYCLEIWNYLTSPLQYSPTSVTPILKQPDRTILCPLGAIPYDSATPCPSNYFDHTLFPDHTFNYTYLVGVDYCQSPNVDKYVFECFNPSSSAPKFVLLHNLISPTLAGVYNFTLSVTNRTNWLGYPDFVHAWNTTLQVPVSMAYNAGYIAGNICNAGTGLALVAGFNCLGPIRGKGVVYALQCPAAPTPCTTGSGKIVARAYVDQSQCIAGSNCGRFNLTGLAPGNYIVEGSAGVDAGVAYSLTPYGYPTPIILSVAANQGSSIQLPLRYAPLVCGSISYQTPGGGTIAQSLSAHPYLIAAGFRSNPNFNLNITVEGTDSFGHVFRFQNVSGDGSSDSFTLITGFGVKYVGTDPYGTEFAGLPAPEDSGAYSLTVSIWVSGYVQPFSETVVVSQSPGPTPPACTSPLPAGSFTVSPNPVPMRSGGVITGMLQFCNTFQTCTPESPDAAQNDLPVTAPPDTLFGGNVVIEAFDANGLLRGVTVINGTLPSGATSYASEVTLPFYITGFSEYYNHTQSGTWESYGPNYGHDCGLPDGVYTLQVFLRGYELTSMNPSLITILGGSNQTVTALMTRGGAFQITVGSYDNRFGNRTIQAELSWRFLNSTIPIAVRVYFFAGSGMVGYVERVMETGDVPNGVGLKSFVVVFAGQNWSLREIWFYGLLPTHVTNNNYTISPYTLGYVPQNPPGITLQNTLVGFSQGLIAMFYANEVDITTPIYQTPQTLSAIREYDHAIGQVFSGSLYGAEMYNISADITPVPTLQFNIFGFGAMELSNQTECFTKVALAGSLSDSALGLTYGGMNLCGQGHFFYVDPDGTRYFDYGLDQGSYTAALPEFGFLAHYLQILTPPTVTFGDLFLQAGVLLQAVQMATIYVPNGGIQGFIDSSADVAPLSWAQLQATNTTYSNSASTGDGGLTGVSALFLPAGAFNITIADTNQYQPQTIILQVAWGGSYAIQSIFLCPSATACP